jgi:hypothetical protein
MNKNRICIKMFMLLTSYYLLCFCDSTKELLSTPSLTNLFSSAFLGLVHKDFIYIYICLLSRSVFWKASDCHTCYSKQRHKSFIVLSLLTSTILHTKNLSFTKISHSNYRQSDRSFCQDFNFLQSALFCLCSIHLHLRCI